MADDLAHNGLDPAVFDPFRLTERTVVRPPQETFSPRFRVERAVHEHLRIIERADQDLRRARVDARTEHRLLREALTRNAYGTASIEGNPLTLEDVESLLAEGPTPERLEIPDEREIINHADFLRTLDGESAPRTPSDVAALHARLFEGVLADRGRFKTSPNFVGKRPELEVVFVATRPERVEAELAAALDWYHGADEHPLVRAAVLFHEVQSIHPFRDGNGRLGRALSTLLLHQNGYPGVRYALIDFTFNRERDTYYAKLAEAQTTGWDLTPWLTYMIDVMARTFEAAARRFLLLRALPEELNDRQADVAVWVARLDQGRPGRRLKFNDVHAVVPAVPRRTLQHDLARLVEHRVLVREGAGKGTTYHLSPRFSTPT